MPRIVVDYQKEFAANRSDSEALDENIQRVRCAGPRNEKVMSSMRDAGLPFDLRREFEAGNLVLFVGAGFVRNYLPSMPLWEDLLAGAFEALSGNQMEIFNYCSHAFDVEGRRIVPMGEYLRLAEKFELAREKINRERHSRGEEEVRSIHELVVRRLWPLSDTAAAKNALVGKHIERARELPLPIWITTNFDTFLEDAVLDDRETLVLSRPVNNQDFHRARARMVLKIHGSIRSNRPTESIVITEGDYHRFLRTDRYLANKLYTLFCERTIVFLGYSLSDPNIQYIYNEVLYDQKRFGEAAGIQSFSQLRPAFFISRESIPEEEKAYFLHKRIHYVPNYDIERFFGDLICAWEEFEYRKKSVVDRVKLACPEYLALLQKFGTVSEPPVNVADESKREYLEKLFDLIELHEVSCGDPAGLSGLDGFSNNGLVGAVHRILALIDDWCSHAFSAQQTDVPESVFDFVEEKLSRQRSFVCEFMIRKMEKWLLTNAGTVDLSQFIRRYFSVLRSYDALHNDWGDYTFCLKRYVRLTRLFDHLDLPAKKEATQGLYNQLAMCGRDMGDSWYTTDAVYEIWSEFNIGTWSLLEEEIRRHTTVHNGTLYPEKARAMLEFLRPGADHKSFLPRTS